MTTLTPTSPFLRLPQSSWVASNALAFAIRDNYPVSDGHTLIIPRRLVVTWFDATPEEQKAIFDLVDVVKRQLDDLDPKPDGYNVGFNAGEAAGQTVMHLPPSHGLDCLLVQEPRESMGWHGR
jgi:diadenosine tetraphosphate (Ap4A) HIT family hydrolase